MIDRNIQLSGSCLALLLAVSLCAGDAYAGEKGTRAREGDRVLNGVEVDGTILKAPWILSLQKNDKHICGASFIAPKFTQKGDFSQWTSEARDPVWAVTAAHCVVSKGVVEDPQLFKVLGGTLDLTANKGEHQQVKQIFVPSAADNIGAYDPTTLENDIALLLLADSQQNLQARRLSIRLPTNREIEWAYSPYTSVYTAGWGRKEDGFASKKLMQVQLPMVDRDTCAKKYAPFGDDIVVGMMCAGFVSGEYDACQGDSGGPLYYKPSDTLGRTAHPVLLGVVSWGRGCGQSDLFGVYTQISVFEDWIRATVETHRKGGG